MEQIQARIAFLESRIQQVIQSQEQQNAEILSLITELKALKQQVEPEPVAPPMEPSKSFGKKFSSSYTYLPKPKLTWFNIGNKAIEDLIGRNLINRIGILITVIGVFIGAKYAIDKNLISPPLRIIFGYLMSVALASVAIYLRRSYKEYSAVVMSGAIAIFYFITYIGFNFYQLFPQLLAFFIMFIATGLSVATSLWYNNRFIALMGQVGAYAIPFLLSTSSGNVMFLFAYMCIVNIGMLILSFRKDWRQIYQIAFYTSWLIFIALNPWQQKQYSVGMKIFVLTTQMLIFYAAFISYKLWRKESYKIQEVLVLLINAVIYYIVGQAVLKASTTGVSAVTIFTLSNALLHFSAGFWILNKPVQDKSLYLFLVGLGISFLTISIPVAFKGNWITIFWSFEAVVLGLVAYRSSRGIYLTLSNVLIVLTLISLVMDWEDVFMQVQSKVWVKAFMNQYFISSIVAVSSIGILSYLAQKNERIWAVRKDRAVQWALPLLFIATGYFSIVFEMDHLWQIRNYDLAFYAFRIPAALLFTLIYFSIWQYLNLSKWKNKGLSIILFVVTIYITAYSLIFGMGALADMRDLFLEQHVGSVLPMMGFRYLMISAIALLLFLTHNSLIIAGFEKAVYRAFIIGIHISSLSMISNEFIHWMEVAGQTGQYELGLTIISGLYALAMLFYGIREQKQYIRISAIVLLGLTLLKLLIYDIASLSTISKTVVLIILGVILLIASFLYTKYREAIVRDKDSVQHDDV